MMKLYMSVIQQFNCSTIKWSQDGFNYDESGGFHTFISSFTGKREGSKRRERMSTDWMSKACRNARHYVLNCLAFFSSDSGILVPVCNIHQVSIPLHEIQEVKTLIWYFVSKPVTGLKLLLKSWFKLFQKQVLSLISVLRV